MQTSYMQDTYRIDDSIASYKQDCSRTLKL